MKNWVREYEHDILKIDGDSNYKTSNLVSVKSSPGVRGKNTTTDNVVSSSHQKGGQWYYSTGGSFGLYEDHLNSDVDDNSLLEKDEDYNNLVSKTKNLIKYIRSIDNKEKKSDVIDFIIKRITNG